MQLCSFLSSPHNLFCILTCVFLNSLDLYADTAPRTRLPILETLVLVIYFNKLKLLLGLLFKEHFRRIYAMIATFLKNRDQINLYLSNSNFSKNGDYISNTWEFAYVSKYLLIKIPKFLTILNHCIGNE